MNEHKPPMTLREIVEAEGHNDGNVHGYVWSDGSVHDEPEPVPVTLADHAARLDNLEGVVSPITRKELADYRVAFAQYQKDYKAWARAFSAWEAKHGSR